MAPSRKRSGVSAGVKSATVPAMSIPIILKPKSNIPALVRILFKNENAAVSPSDSFIWAKIGTIAEVNAPSPSSRLKRLGRVKANVYAALTADNPKYAIVVASLMKPSMREPIVADETFSMFLKTLTVFLSIMF